MLEFYRRAWRAFLAAFIGSMGIAAGLIRDYSIGSRVMFIVAAIFLVVFLIGLYYDYRDARREAREKKTESTHKALVESFKALYIKEGKSPEEAQKLAEIAGADMPLAPPIEGEEEWVSPRETHKKSRRKHR